MTEIIGQINELEINGINEKFRTIQRMIDTIENQSYQPYNVNLGNLISSVYFVDYTERDQGATGNGRSIKALVDSIGTTENATLVFQHFPLNGNTVTEYKILTSLLVSANITLSFQNGAVIVDTASNASLTILGEIIANKRNQIFDFENGTGKVKFDGGRTSIAYPEWWGAAGDGTTDDAAALNAVCLSVKAVRGIVSIGANVKHLIESQVTISEIALIGTHRGDEASEGSKIIVSSGVTGLYATGVKTRIENLNIWGVDSYVGNTTAIPGSTIGISIYEVHMPKISHCSFHRLSTAVLIEGRAGTYGHIIQDCNFQMNTTGVYAFANNDNNYIFPNYMKILYNTFVNDGAGVAIRLTGPNDGLAFYVKLIGNRIENQTTAFALTRTKECSYIDNEVENTCTNLFTFTTNEETDAVDCIWVSGGGGLPAIQIGALPSSFTPAAIKVRGYNHANDTAEISTDYSFTVYDFANVSTNAIASLSDSDIFAAGLTANYLAIRFAGAAGNGMMIVDGTTERLRIDKEGIIYFSGAPQSLSGAGAINATTAITEFTSTGVGDALTIANGVTAGQIKIVKHIVDGGSGQLTGANLAGTSVTFTDDGEAVTLSWSVSQTKWFVIGGNAVFAP